MYGTYLLLTPQAAFFPTLITYHCSQETLKSETKIAYIGKGTKR